MTDFTREELQDRIYNLEAEIEMLQGQLDNPMPNSVVKGTEPSDIAVWLCGRQDIIDSFEPRLQAYNMLRDVAMNFCGTVDEVEVGRHAMFRIDDFSYLYGNQEFIQKIIRDQWKDCPLITNWNDDHDVYGVLDEGWDMFKEAYVQALVNYIPEESVAENLERQVILCEMGV